jgi:signal peptidase I
LDSREPEADIRPPGEEEGLQRPDFKREIREFAKLILWFLALFLVLRSFVVEGYEVQGDSMLPTLESNDRILVFKLPHLARKWGLLDALNSIEPGDIIVFESPDTANRRYVKRVVAEGPGPAAAGTVAASPHYEEETVSVQLVDGHVFVNNHLVEEKYLPSDVIPLTESTDKVLLHTGEYFVLGDNRPVSKDSRSFDAVKDDRIIGTTVLRFWPLSKFGFVN